MERPKTKKETRRELDEQMQSFIEAGGSITEVPRGTSGNEGNTNLFKTATQFQPRVERTPLTSVVKELEARKHSKHIKAPVYKSRPKRKLLVDDFGDPIRWVWEDK